MRTLKISYTVVTLNKMEKPFISSILFEKEWNSSLDSHKWNLRKGEEYRIKYRSQTSKV